MLKCTKLQKQLLKPLCLNYTNEQTNKPLFIYAHLNCVKEEHESISSLSVSF